MTEEHSSRPATDEIEIIGSESACSYLPNRSSQMIFRIALSLTSTRYEELLSRGWRRFGRTLFRPQCSGCVQCMPTFLPTNSQTQMPSTSWLHGEPLPDSSMPSSRPSEVPSAVPSMLP
ncbi:MAG: hypothetical protein GY826_18370, partial [Fuerstiella sp.]|nr:hypothetical protein [Fuerstiella sp.]